MSVATGVLATAMSAVGTSSVSFHGTLESGSSTHGIARRANVASNWVQTYGVPSTVCRNAPAVFTGSYVAL